MLLQDSTKHKTIKCIIIDPCKCAYFNTNKNPYLLTWVDCVHRCVVQVKPLSWADISGSPVEPLSLSLRLIFAVFDSSSPASEVCWNNQSLSKTRRRVFFLQSRVTFPITLKCCDDTLRVFTDNIDIIWDNNLSWAAAETFFFFFFRERGVSSAW